MKPIKLPWNVRADRLRIEREEAEKKKQEVEKDWEPLLKYKQAIDREVELNNWTSTAVAIFSGKGEPR